MVKIFRLIPILIMAVLIFSNAMGQSEKDRVANYINQYKELAIREMIRTGVPASIKLAQGILETGGGQSSLASNAFNHFGIKCKTEWTGDKVFHDDDEKGECFRKYNSVEESYYDHSEFLLTRPHYAFLFKLDPTDYEGWAKGLKKAGYATNPAYPQRLIKIIVENNLQEFSLLALERKKTIETELFTTVSPGSEAPTTGTHAANTASIQEANNPVKEMQETISSIVNDQPSALTNYPANKVFVINDIKVIYAEAGTSLLAIANNHHLSYNKLLEFNELAETEILAKDQLIFLQKKSKKGNKDFHVVEKGETVYDVAQKNGVQLSSLLEFNKIMRGMEPAAGSKLYLKGMAPVLPRLVNSKNGNVSTTM